VRFEFGCVDPGCAGVLALSGFYQDQLVVGVPWCCPVCARFQLAKLTDRECPPSRETRIEFAAAEDVAMPAAPDSAREGGKQTRRLLRSRR
jgi:hypothetical protein